MVFKYKDAPGKGCFEDYQKMLTGATPWFIKLTSVNDLTTWWQTIAPEIDDILDGSSTSIKQLLEWYKSKSDNNYPLTSTEDGNLRKLFVYHIVNVPVFTAAFKRIGHLHRPDKTSLSRDGTAAYFLSEIIAEYAKMKTLGTAKAKANLQIALQAQPPHTIDGVRKWCESLHLTLIELRSLLTDSDYANECMTATHYCDNVFSSGLGALQWNRTATEADLLDRLYATPRAIEMMQAFGSVGNTVASAFRAGASEPASGAPATAKPTDKPPGRSNTMTCNTCRQTGHIASRCDKADKCMKCGSKDHKTSTCKETALKCEACGKGGHLAVVCLKKKDVAAAYGGERYQSGHDGRIGATLDTGARDVVTPSPDLLAEMGPPTVLLSGITGPVRPSASGKLAASVRGKRNGLVFEHRLPPMPGHVLPSSPVLLPPGRLVMEHGYKLSWSSKDGAELSAPDGTALDVSVNASDYSIGVALLPAPLSEQQSDTSGFAPPTAHAISALAEATRSPQHQTPTPRQMEQSQAAQTALHSAPVPEVPAQTALHSAPVPGMLVMRTQPLPAEASAIRTERPTPTRRSSDVYTAGSVATTNPFAILGDVDQSSRVRPAGPRGAGCPQNGFTIEKARRCAARDFQRHESPSSLPHRDPGVSAPDTARSQRDHGPGCGGRGCSYAQVSTAGALRRGPCFAWHPRGLAS
jgi:hypothetical protein